jgi:hypothetical protein
MASIDGAYYFLTVLIPVRTRWPEGESGHRSAPIIELREKLARMPTAMQTPGTTEGGKISAFSRSTRTHFARFAVIDRLGYNGYTAPDPIFSTITRKDAAQTRQELERPYLLFAAEFDAPSRSKSYDLAVWLRELWEIPELRRDLIEIFRNCEGFANGEQTTAAEAINFIRKCEIETTMPFNHYWMDEPTLPTITLPGLAIGALLAGLVPGLAIGIPLWRFLPEGWKFMAVVIGALLVLAGAVLFVGWRLKSMGDRPFPPPPDADLVSVLKSLHLQRTFGRFVIEHQGVDAQTLHASFGRYLDANRPSEAQPRHPAGKVYP